MNCLSRGCLTPEHFREALQRRPLRLKLAPPYGEVWPLGAGTGRAADFLGKGPGWCLWQREELKLMGIGMDDPHIGQKE